MVEDMWMCVCVAEVGELTAICSSEKHAVSITVPLDVDAALTERNTGRRIGRHNIRLTSDVVGTTSMVEHAGRDRLESRLRQLDSR
jgi:hypothetical protein